MNITMPTTSSTMTTSSMNITMPTTTTIFKEISYKSGIIQISPNKVSFEYKIIKEQSMNIDDSIKMILDKIGAIDIKYSKLQVADIMYVSIYKNSIEHFEVMSYSDIKYIIFRFTPETTYLIEPLLKLDLSINNNINNNIIYMFFIIMIIIMSYYILKKVKVIV
jgi:hypothetical protein